MDLLTTATSRDERERGASIAVLPVGSFEQHGDHLPLTTDTVIACVIANAVAERYNVLLLPPITISCSHEHAAFAGTVSVSARTLHGLINDIRESLARAGVHRLVLVNAHGGNYVLSNVVQEANEHGVQMALFPAREDWMQARKEAGLATTQHEDMHAGELEVSILLHAYPDLVRASYKDADHKANDRPHLLVLGMTAYTQSGVIGVPSAATTDKGAALVASLVDSFAACHNLLSSLPTQA